MAILVLGVIRHQSLLVASAATKSNGQEYERKSYSVNILIAKNDPVINQINAELAALIAVKFKGAGLPSSAHHCFKDLAVTDPSNVALANYYELRATSWDKYQRPECTLHDGVTPAMAGDIKIGDKIHIQVALDVYDTGNGGTSAYLNASLLTGEVGNIPIDAISSRQPNTAVFASVLGNQQVQQVPVQQVPTLTPYSISQGYTYESLKATGSTDDVMRQNGWII